MARLYADEQFPVQVVFALRKLGHDVVTVRETCVDKRGDGMTDKQVLDYAIVHRRCVLTENHSDFRVLHNGNSNHKGIIACAFVKKSVAKTRARGIDRRIKEENILNGKFIWISREPNE
jgi:predicted nuclease of predicted toxin-antitoxin system